MPFKILGTSPLLGQALQNTWDRPALGTGPLLGQARSWDRPFKKTGPLVGVPMPGLSFVDESVASSYHASLPTLNRMQPLRTLAGPADFLGFLGFMSQERACPKDFEGHVPRAGLSQERACPKSGPVPSILEGLSQERACPKYFEGHVPRAGLSLEGFKWPEFYWASTFSRAIHSGS